MNQVPHILLKQVQIYQPELQLTTAVDMFNQINQKIDAYNKANAEQITAEEARKLGAGKAEWRHVGGTWAVIGEVHSWFEGAQYRAIKAQPEPVEPHVFSVRGNG